MQGRGMPLPARHCRSEQAIMKMSRTPDLSLRGGAADVAISGRHYQFVQGIDKMVSTNCVCSGAQGVPLAAANFRVLSPTTHSL